HGARPQADLPSEWPPSYARTVRNRMNLIEENPAVRLIEQPEYKRRWSVEQFKDRLHRLSRSSLLARLENRDVWRSAAITSTARLADSVTHDPEVLRIARQLSGSEDDDVSDVLQHLIQEEAVPFLPVLRYTDTGARKREDWERTWELQRAEDAIDARMVLP